MADVPGRMMLADLSLPLSSAIPASLSLNLHLGDDPRPRRGRVRLGSLAQLLERALTTRIPANRHFCPTSPKPGVAGSSPAPPPRENFRVSEPAVAILRPPAGSRRVPAECAAPAPRAPRRAPPAPASTTALHDLAPHPAFLQAPEDEPGAIPTQERARVSSWRRCARFEGGSLGAADSRRQGFRRRAREISFGSFFICQGSHGPANRLHETGRLTRRRERQFSGAPLKHADCLNVVPAACTSNGL